MVSPTMSGTVVSELKKFASHAGASVSTFAAL